jgi:hypothetical protein
MTERLKMLGCSRNALPSDFVPLEGALHLTKDLLWK